MRSMWSLLLILGMATAAQAQIAISVLRMVRPSK